MGENGSIARCNIDIGVDTCITDHVVTVVNLVFNCILLNIVTVLGTFGNVINIIVLSSHGMKESTNIILMSISIADLIFLGTLTSRGLTCVVSKFDVLLATTIDAYVLAYIFVFNRLIGLVSSAQVTLISIERFVAVYYPLSVSSLLSPKRTVLVITSLTLFWLVVVSPFFNFYSYEWWYDTDLNVTFARSVVTDFYLNNFEAMNKLNLSFAILRGPIAVFVILVSSVAICKRLHDAGKKRSKMTSFKQKFDVRVVKMLLLVTAVYAAVGIPLSLPYILYYLAPKLMVNEDKTVTNLLIVLETINDFFYAINASINFVIYVTMSNKFYNTYTSLFSCLLPTSRAKKADKRKNV